MISSYDYSNQYVAVVPMEKKSMEFLQEVDRKTKGDIQDRFGIYVTLDWQCNTIANQVIEAIITTLGYNLAADNSITAVNFFNLFSIGVSYRKFKSAEKEGNLTIVFKPGSRLDQMVKDDELEIPEEYDKEVPLVAFTVGREDIDNFYGNIDTVVRYALSQNNSIIISDKDKYAVIAITYTFFENLFKKLILDVRNNEDGDSSKSVEFNELIGISLKVDNDGYHNFTLYPDVSAKLLIKSDKFTEGDYDE